MTQVDFQSYKPNETKSLSDERSYTIQKTLLKPILGIIATFQTVLQSIERRSKGSNHLRVTTQSILDHKVEFPVLQSSDDLPAILGQILCDSIIGGSELEKLSPDRGIETWIKYLETSSYNAKILPLLSCLKQLLDHSSKQKHLLNQADLQPAQIVEFAKETMTVVHNLNIGQSFLIEGGRTDEDGIHHPVVFEIIKWENNCYDLKVYLMGKEENQHRLTVEESSKIWFSPAVKYRKIPELDLFFNDEKQDIQPDFFQAIIETKLNKKFTAEFVALKLLGHLQVYREEEKTIDPDQVVSEPDSHSDALRETKALVLAALGKTNYKNLIIEIHFRALVEGYQLCKDLILQDDKRGDTLRIVLKKGAQTFLKKLLVKEMRGNVPTEFFKMAQATAEDVVKRIDIVDHALVEQRKSISTPLYLEDYEKDSGCVAREQCINSAKAQIARVEKKNSKIVSTPGIRTFSLPLARDFTDAANAYLQSGPADKKVVAYEIEQLVDLLPIPASSNLYWGKLESRDLPSAMQCLGKMLNQYDLSTFGTSVITPKQANTVFALYAIIHHIAVRLDNEKQRLNDDPASFLSYYPLYFPGLDYDKDPYLVFFSLRDFERREQLFGYFKGTYFIREQSKDDEDGAAFDAPIFNFADSTCIKEETLSGHEKWLAALSRSYAPLEMGQCFPLEAIAALMPNLLIENKEKPNKFVEAGLEYIPILAHAAFLAHQFSSHSSMREDSLREMYVQAYKSKSKVKVTYGTGKDQDKTIVSGRQPSSLKIHPKIDIKTETWLSNHVWNRRLKKFDTRMQEANALDNGNALLKQACEPSLYPYKLLAYYNQHIANLESPAEQVLFEVEFFRSVSFRWFDEDDEDMPFDVYWEPYTRSSVFPLHEELKKQHLKEQCRQFIQEGVDCYLKRQPASRPHVLPLLFFLRLVMRLNSFIEKPEFLDPLPILVEVLKRDDLHEKERSAACLHLGAAYLYRGSELSIEEKELLFSSWIYYKNTSISSTSKSPHLEREVEDYVYKQCLGLKNFSAPFYQKMLSVVLKNLGVGDLPPKFEMKIISPTHIKAFLPDGSRWEMDFLSGQISNNGITMRRTEAPHWVHFKLFQFIFNSTPSSFIQSGAIIYFAHPLLGSCRVVGDDLASGLQRNIGGVWYQFLPHAFVANKGLPSALIADHTHWFSSLPSPEPLLICHRSTGKKVASVLGSGEIFQDNYRVYGSIANGVLSKFESSEYILNCSEGGALASIHFTRYQSLNGEPLHFDIEKGKAIYSANRKYHLSESQRNDHLGTIEQYLLLTDEENGKQKIIIPFRFLASYTPLSSRHAIDIAERQHPEDTSLTRQENSLRYLEFDIDGDKIIPLSQEGTCFLAYLNLANRKYLQAVELIATIDYRKPLSKVCVDTMINIIKLADSGKDSSGEASAVALHAWTLGAMAKERCEKEGKELLFTHKLWNSLIDKALKRYKRHRHKILHGLHLSDTSQDYLPVSLQANGTVSTHYPRPAEYHPAPFRGYGAKKEKNIEDINDKDIKFLPDGSASTSLSTYRAPMLLTKSDEESSAYFSEAYEIAQHGTQGQKAQIAFRLQLKGEQYIENPSDAWTYLQHALKNAERAPKLPTADLHDRKQFVQEISKQIAYASRQDHERSGKLAAEQIPYRGGELARSLMPPPTVPKSVKDVESPFQLRIPNRQAIGQGFMTALFLAHIGQIKKEDEIDVKGLISYNDQWLSKDEKVFDAAFRTELAEFEKDYQQGRKVNNEQKIFNVKDVDKLKKHLTVKINDLEGDLADLESALLELANQKPFEKSILEVKEAAGLAKELSLKELVALFLQGDKVRFYEANPQLKDPLLIKRLADSCGFQPREDLVVDYLYNLIGIYLSQSVYVNRLKRAEKLCGKIEKIDDEKNPNRFAMVQRLAAEVHPHKQPNYSLQNYPAFLVFEYLSGFTLRPEQVSLLQKLLEVDEKTKTYKSRIIQLIMGGGKTTVLPVILLMLAAKPGRLSLFVTPASQYTTVSYDFAKNHARVLWQRC